MKAFKLLAWVSFMTASVRVLHSEPHCPENIAGVHLRSFDRVAIAVRIEVNHTGPYDFLIDTGAQITQIDPALASELHLESRGNAGMVGVGQYTRGVPLVELNDLQVGSHDVESVLAAVNNLNQIQTADRRIRGVVGENFLRNFDVLIDYGQNVLCLDETRRMEQSVKGERIPLVSPLDRDSMTTLPETLVIPVRLSGGKTRSMHLILDSGSNSPLLYCRHNGKESPSERAAIRWAAGDGTEREFAMLAPQDIRIGERSIRGVSFVAPIGAGNDIPEIGADGLLPTALFRRVYISYANRFAVLDLR
jgi:hypothetical protein